MALDPSLITNVMSRWQGPQPPDPIERAAKLQALRSGVLQQQAAAQNLQTGALELQQRQQEIAGQKALSDAIRDNMTAGPNGLPVINHAGVATALGSGGFGNLIPKYQEGVATQQKTQADALKLQMENQATMLDQASRYFADANDQPSWDGAIAHAVGLGADPAKLGIPPIYSPEAKQKVQDMALTTKDRLAATAAQMDAKAKADAQTLASEKERVAKVNTARQALGAATNQDELDAARQALTTAGAKPEEMADVPTLYSPDAQAHFNRRLMTGEQRTQADQAAANAKAIADYRANETANRAKQLAVEQQNAGINAKKFAMEFGGDAVKGWSKQVADNPDTAGQVPPPLRSAVMQQFTADTGQPFPKPLTGTAVDLERTSRNALDAVAQVKAALADPEIQKRIGPIMGRFGEAEQAAGTAVGLTPEQEAKAQQLRTNMRYLVFTEAKALLGGRMPQNLVKQLEASSPNVAMDMGTMNGALAAVTDAAGRNLDQTYKQRFGENAVRPGSAQARQPAAAATYKQTATGAGGHKIGTNDGKTWFDIQTGQKVQ